MPSETEILSLVEQIYDAASDSSLWGTFLGNFVKVMDSSVAALTLHDGTSQAGSMSASAFLEASWLQTYSENYAPKNVHIINAANKGFAIPGTLITGEMAIRDTELVHTEFYNDFLRPQNLKYLLGGLIARQDSMMSLISTHRAPHKGAFQDEEVRTATLLMPHLRRAAKFHRLITGLKRERDFAADCLNHTQTGFMVVNQNSRVANYAERLLEKNDGLSLRYGRLHISNAATAHQVGALVKAAASVRQNISASREFVAVPRLSMSRPYLLSIYPLRGQSPLFEKDQPVAALSIVDPELRVAPPAVVLKQMFGLTRAESTLALLLSRGKTLEECAEELHVSRNTVRSQLREILAKTGTSRQSELIRLLITVAS